LPLTSPLYLQIGTILRVNYPNLRKFWCGGRSTAASTGSDIHRILLKIIAGYSGIQTDPSNITMWARKLRA
jgi:hypothetical protein